MGAASTLTPYMALVVSADGMYRELTQRGRAVILAVEVRDMVTAETLERFFVDGWNARDVVRLMTFMTDDCRFDSAAGPAACGTRHAGGERVREAFAALLARFPDLRFTHRQHLVSGDRGLSEWRFTATAPDGRAIDVDGCDLFTFRGDKIAVKSSYLKSRG
jgi:ketosteroid isomerase-like protein